MPSKGLRGLAKFSHQKSQKGAQSGENRTQLTISKFFFPPAVNRDDQTNDDVIVIDDTESESLKRKHPEEKVPSPFKKKARHTDNNSAPDVSFVTEHVEKPGVDAAVLSRVKDKLKTFEASESLGSAQTTENFNFNVLKRDRLSHLPDINLAENNLISDTSVNDKQGKSSVNDKPGKSSVNDKPGKVDKLENELDTCTAFDSDLKDVEFQKHSLAKCKASKSVKNREPVCSKVTMKQEPVSKLKYTQLEQQVVEIKEKYPDTVLFVECGYKYRFFGKDAEIAASVLKIFCHQDHNFMTASIPTHRLFVHLRRIVTAGYKVGVVKQMETAALKAAGNNKRTPFTRELTALYTKSTLIGEDSSTDTGGEGSSDSSLQTSNTYLVCVSDHITESKSKNKQIGLVAVQPSTGDIIYDSFDDDESCSELETRLAHIQPVEVLLSEHASASTCKLVRNLSAVSYTEEDRLRIEKLPDSVYHHNNAVKTISKFYQEKGTGSEGDSRVLQEILNLPKPVLCCMSALITYLTDFKLEKILAEFSNFRRFSLKTSHMQLNKECLKNLEVFQNSTNGRETGSLFWALNQTLTRPGSRLLQTWLSQPLLSHEDIISRQTAVSDILNDKINDTSRLKGILGKLPDLEKTLVAVYHKKCSCSQVYNMLRHFEILHDEFKLQGLSENQGHVTSTLLKDIVSQLPDLLENVRDFKSALVEKAALENNKTELYANESHFPALQSCKTEIEDVRTDIQGHRREVRLALRQPALEFTTVLGTEFLIEVKNQHISLVPDSWVKISSTKAVSRFHSPFIVEKYARLQQLREQLVIECEVAWQQFLQELSEHYQRLKKAIQLISTLDCLMSLATVAQMHGYTRPEICADDVCIEVRGGRHPVIQELIGQSKQYVSNDTNLNVNGEHVMVITGPNMGGKSCYIKQVALLTILAQIGSYVPADSAKLGIFDAIYTRMGAEDMIYKGQSTFMVELSEVSSIMVKATSRSLVILDELGRGTSTHDGVAIAYSVLDFFINQPSCLTLFVTHYPLLAEIEHTYPGIVGNFHMSFLLHDLEEGETIEDKITFLYQLVRGMAAKSYGLNVACLANVPSEIVEVAAGKSRELEYAVQRKRKWISLFKKLCTSNAENMHQVLTEIKECL